MTDKLLIGRASQARGQKPMKLKIFCGDTDFMT